MVMRADSGITSLEQMRGKPRLGRSELDLGLPGAALRAAPRGHRRRTAFFRRTGFGGGHEQAVVAVLQRQYDAGVTWASGLGEEQGFTRGNLRAMVEKGMLNMRDLRIIWTVAPDPERPDRRAHATCRRPSATTCTPSTWRCPRRIRDIYRADRARRRGRATRR